MAWGTLTLDPLWSTNKEPSAQQPKQRWGSRTQGDRWWEGVEWEGGWGETWNVNKERNQWPNKKHLNWTWPSGSTQEKCQGDRPSTAAEAETRVEALCWAMYLEPFKQMHTPNHFTYPTHLLHLFILAEMQNMWTKMQRNISFTLQCFPPFFFFLQETRSFQNGENKDKMVSETSAKSQIFHR